MPNYLSSNGTPADNVGVTGDFSLDYGNRFLWGPKPSDTSWAGSAKSIVGPTGATGALSPPVLSAFASTYGVAAQIAGQTVGTGNTPMFFPGTNIPHTFTPQVNTSLTGLTVSNYAASGATIYFYLYNLTDGAIVFNYNSGNGIANNTTAAITIPIGQVVLTAGKTYQWACQRVTAAASTIQVSPQYLTPAQSSIAVSTYSTNFVHATAITLSNNGVLLQPAGFTAAQADRGYYRNALASFVYSLDYALVGSGSASFVISDGSVVLWTSPVVTATSAGTRGTFGPFNLNTIYIAPSRQVYFYTQGSGGSVTANLTITIGQ